jgi:hypothetical protein
MSHIYKAIPLTGEAAAAAFFDGALARVACKPSVPQERWPIIGTNLDIGETADLVTIPSSEICLVSFDAIRWWSWSFDDSEEADDNPGALDWIKTPDSILCRYMRGEVSAELCEKRLDDLGLAFDWNSCADDASDDPGAEDAGD